MSTEIESLKTDLATRRVDNGASPLWFAVAIIALLLAVVAHWRFGRFDERLDRLHTQLAELHATQAQLASQLETLGGRLERADEQLRTQLRNLREVPAQVGELGQTVAELRARTEAPQRAWVRAEALYLLELAARRLRLEHDIPTAIAAMESADARLATVSDPAVAEVRAQVARELAALRAIAVPNLPDVIARLTTLEQQAENFRVLGVPVASARRLSGTPQTEASPIDRALNRIRQAWHDLFSYRRVEPATTRLVTRQEERLRRQHLALELFAARISAMQQDRAAYLRSIGAAREWLERYFDPRDPAVAGARDELIFLAATDIDPERPEIGKAAQLLQRVIGASSPTP